MAWVKEAVTLGEIKALQHAASLAWDDDTKYPRWKAGGFGGGQCYVTSRWLVDRLGGYVGIKQGCYAWISPDGRYAIDLTGNHTGDPYYGPAEGYSSVAFDRDERTTRFCKRANRLFDHMIKTGDMIGDAFPGEEPQRANDIASQAPVVHDEPGLDNSTTSDGLYNFLYINGGLEVSPIHSHQELKQHLGIDGDHQGPIAVGHISVTQNMATWDVHSNVNVRTLFKIFKDYSEHIGWKWGGLTNIDGEPIDDDFAPKKSATKINYIYDDHLYMGNTSHAILRLQSTKRKNIIAEGTITVVGNKANVYPVSSYLLDHLFEWAEDQGLTLYSWQDNEVKRHEDLELDNLGNPDANQDFNPVEPDGDDDPIRGASGLYRCPACKQLFPNWQLYEKHRRDEEPWDDSSEITPGGFPEIDMDATFPTHFTEQQPDAMFPLSRVIPMSYREAARVPGFDRYAQVFGYDDDVHSHYCAYHYGSVIGYASVTPDNHIQMVQSAVKGKGVARALMIKLMSHYPVLYTNTSYDWERDWLERMGWLHLGGQRYKFAQGQQPSDMLEAPIPFIYDVENDKIDVGEPGQRTSDIHGQFTPGGIIEGNYEPGGKVVVTTMTNMPYSVRHMIELWYYSHPQYTVKNVVMMDASNKETKLAAKNAGTLIRTLVSAHSVVDEAQRALTGIGGHVYVVGGAVRDAIIGKDPNDLDLMVTGLTSDQIKSALGALPGTVAHTGSSFGVFRYRHGGHEVEIAMPRTDISTGPTHTDFDVSVDHTLSPEEDLQRRDFTANAMAIDLATGTLIDPFNGVDDLQNGVLRTVSINSFDEDPLRLLRAVVAHAKHGLTPDDDTFLNIHLCAETIIHEPGERIRDELDKIIASDNPVAGIRFAQKVGLLRYVLPEVDAMFGYNQNNPHHEFMLGDHSMNVLERVASRTTDVDLRWAALLHDVGKPGSQWLDPVTGKSHFYRGPNGEGHNHQDLGADMAVTLLNRLRFANDRIARISSLVRHHMFPAFSTRNGARKFLNKVGNHADDLMILRWGDQGGKSAYPTKPELTLDKQQDLLHEVRANEEATSVSQLAINGNDLIEIGIPQGPKIGRILNDFVDEVLEYPELNTREVLLGRASNLVIQDNI